MIRATTSEKLRETTRKEALLLGFDTVGFAHAALPTSVVNAYREFVNLDHHGSMDWLEDTFARRSNPRQLWPQVKSVIVLAMNYGPEFDPLNSLHRREEATLSVYARNRDYHDVIKGRLKTLASKLMARAQTLNLDGEVKVFVDTAPVMEKPLAQKAGLGWQGKHTNLVSRELGSWFFLGSIFTTLDLGEEGSERDHCGSCHNCLDICPTKAFPKPYQIDARRCISYLTIENKGPIPHEFRKAMGNRIYGCDDCLAVCPWNKFATSASEAKLSSPDSLRDTRLTTLLELNDAGFRRLFAGSPVKRIGRDRFMRNCLIAAGNSNAQLLVPVIEHHLKDPNPIVRGAAVWALGELVSDTSHSYAEIKSRETDPDVLIEWDWIESSSEPKVMQ